MLKTMVINECCYNRTVLLSPIPLSFSTRTFNILIYSLLKPAIIVFHHDFHYYSFATLESHCVGTNNVNTVLLETYQ